MQSTRPGFYLGTDIDGVQLNAEQLNVRSKDLNSLIGSVTYTEALFHILQGRLPTPEERQLFDIVLVAFHGGFGLLPPTTFVPRIVAGTGVNAAQALAVGFLASGPYHVGAVEQAMKYYHSVAKEFRQQKSIDAPTAADLEQFAFDATARRLSSGETVAGFGHPLLRKDPRPGHVRRLLCDLQAESMYFDIYDGVVRCMEQTKGVPPNVDGITGAILLRLGFHHGYGTGLFLMARSAAMLAHIIEEQTEMPYQTMRRFMLVPVVSPRLFNADFKWLNKEFNKLRDWGAFKSLKKLLTRRQSRQIAAQDEERRAAIASWRAQHASRSLSSELASVDTAAPKEDPFVAAAQTAAPDAEQAELTTDLFADCASPELLAGATFLLSSCLRSASSPAAGSTPSDNERRTQQLVESALQLVQQARELTEHSSSE